jgi:sodium-dependent dicarboxylate transporter 2/3/5
MGTAQVAIFFVISYLISRVFVMLKIPELILYYLFEKKHVSIQKLTFILILGSALLSSVIANIITVLTLMPLVILLQKEFDSSGKNKLKINTLFLLSVIWGANIGGIGMITGTTTNGILIGLYEVFKVPLGRDFTFFSWMSWGIPLVVVLSCAGWAILMLMFEPGNVMNIHDFTTKLESISMPRKMQKVGFVMAGVFIITAALLSLSMSIFEDYRAWVLVITIIWMLVFIYMILIKSWDVGSGNRQPLLLFKDTLHDIPKRGILWIIISIIVTLIFWQLKLHKHAGLFLRSLFEERSNVFMFYFLLAIVSTFASELFSNSGVQITMFMVLFPLLKHNPHMSWEGMLVITLCSTCAFMSPIGTPSNGLGYGSSSKISLKHMLSAGFVMNVASALLISVWVFFVVPFASRIILLK